MKKLALLCALVLIAVVAWKYHQDRSSIEKIVRTEEARKSWLIYEKNAPAPRPPSEDEIARLPHVHQVAPRAPASQTPHVPQERKIVGDQSALENFLARDLVELNTPSEDWETFFADEMMRFIDSDTQLLIKHDERLTLVKKNQLRHIEEVTVSYLKNNGQVSSYKAWVDAETGALLNTWARTINHNFRAKPLTFIPENAD